MRLCLAWDRAFQILWRHLLFNAEKKMFFFCFVQICHTNCSASTFSAHRWAVSPRARRRPMARDRPWTCVTPAAGMTFQPVTPATKVAHFPPRHRLSFTTCTCQPHPRQPTPRSPWTAPPPTPPPNWIAWPPRRWLTLPCRRISRSWRSARCPGVAAKPPGKFSFPPCRVSAAGAGVCRRWCPLRRRSSSKVRVLCEFGGLFRER